jgi:PAS domain S-box-containing protein
MDKTTSRLKRIKKIAPAAAGLLVFGLIILLGMMNQALLDRLSDLRSAPRDNVQWGLMQLQNEYSRFQLAVNEAQYSNTSSTAEVAKRFDILYSRLEIIEHAPIYADLRDDGGFAALLERCREGIGQIGAIVDSGRDLAQQLPQLSQVVSSYQAPVQALVLDAVTKFAARSDAERLDLSRFIQNMGIVAAALVLVLMGSIGLLFAQSRTLRKREAALLESRNLMSAISRVSLDAIVVSNDRGEIVEFNTSAQKCFGHDAAQAIGADMAQLVIPERYREAHRKGMERYLATGQTNVIGKRIEIDALHASGQEIPVELAIGVTQSEDGPLFIAYLRDISQRKNDEAALRKALEDANQGIRAKERFLATISHEIRTPLNGVIGVMDLLRDTKLSATQAHYVQIAQQSGQALLSLISDILDLSRMNASGVELHLETVPMHSIVLDAVETTSVGAAANGNRVEIDLGEDVPGSVIADGDRLRQVMLNLLSNAQKFTQAGKIAVSVKRIGGTREKPELEFSVSDTGPGFEPSMAENLFKDFSTLDASYQRQTGGSGLGLAISRRIVEAMGGKIGAEGRPGEGSRFWFTVTLAVASARPRRAEKTSPAEVSLAILVAEDNPTNLLVTRQMLQSAGHRVDEARNGAEAVALARTNAYDAILMDISMPGMDGIEATRHIRLEPGANGQTPIIALTANAEQEGAAQALAAGMNGYLAKPIRRADLIASIGHIIKESRKAMQKPVFDETIYAGLCADISDEGAREVLHTFLYELAGRHGEVRMAHEHGDVHAYGKLCHAIAGAASMVGAAKLATIAHEIDVMNKAGKHDAVLETFRDLEASIIATRDALGPRAAAA